MNNVIGYKGTPMERRENWNLLLMFRKAIEYDKKEKLESLKKTEKLYGRLFEEYRSVA